MFSPRLVLFFIGLLYCARVYTKDILDFECDINNVITITNPNASLYVWAQVNASSYICPSNMTADKIFVSGCFNKSLTMILSNVDRVPTIITSVIKSYSLACIDLPQEGVVRKVVDNTHVIHYVSTSFQPTIIPTIVVNTSLIDMDTGMMKVEAVIGEEVEWHIVAPEQYRIVPEECTAYSGQLPDSTSYSVDIHENGCTIEDSLVTDFRYYNESRHIVVANLYAFRFPNSADVTLSCNVRACPLNSTHTACSLNCTNSRRKREANLSSIDELFSVKFPTTPGLYPKATPTSPSRVSSRRPTSSISSMRRGKAHAVLTVIGEPNVFVDDLPIGASSGQNGAGVLMILLMLSLTFYLFH